MNINISLSHSQQKNKLNIGIQDRIALFLLERSVNAPGFVAVVNALRFYSNIYGNVFYHSQTTIAIRTGLTREYVNKTIRILCSLGWLKKRGEHRQSKTYSLNRFLLSYEISQLLKSIMPAFKWFFKGALKVLFSGLTSQFTPIAKAISLIQEKAPSKIKRTIYSQKQRYFLEKMFKKKQQASTLVTTGAKVYTNFVAKKHIPEDPIVCKARLDQAKAKEPTNFWLHKYAMPGTT